MKKFSSVKEGKEIYIVYNEFSGCYCFIGGAKKFVRWARKVSKENYHAKPSKQLSDCLEYTDSLSDGGTRNNFTVTTQKQTLI